MFLCSASHACWNCGLSSFPQIRLHQLSCLKLHSGSVLCPKCSSDHGSRIRHQKGFPAPKTRFTCPENRPDTVLSRLSPPRISSTKFRPMNHCLGEYPLQMSLRVLVHGILQQQMHLQIHFVLGNQGECTFIVSFHNTRLPMSFPKCLV